MNSTRMKIGIVFSDNALKDASNDPMQDSQINADSLPEAHRTESKPGLTGTQVANLSENLRAELRTVECTMNLFRNEIGQSLDKALHLDFVS